MPDGQREGLPFTKMQAVGNDFVLVDERDWPEGTNWPQIAIKMCDRHFGVGADGFIVVSPSQVADAGMQFFNPDGTPDMCGNGLRCVAAYTFPDGSQHSPSKHISIESPVGVHQGSSHDGKLWTLTMGHPRFVPKHVPVLLPSEDALNYTLSVDGESLIASSVFVGSTHTVLFTERLPSDNDFQRMSPLIESHPLFPERTSVIWVAPVHNPDANCLGFVVRIWERGVGETLGCGTGALAVCVLAQATKRTDHEKIAIHSRGGELFPEYSFGSTNKEMTLGGEAHLVFRGVWHGEG